MPWRLIEDTSYSLALDCALGEPRDDAALEDEDDDDDRNGDDDRGSGDRPRGFFELGGSREERKSGGHGPGSGGRRERDAVHEIVPRDEEGDDRRREHSWRGERHDRFAEGLERRRTVDLGRLFEFPRDLPEERGEGPDRDRQREREVGDDEPGPGVV